MINQVKKIINLMEDRDYKKFLKLQILILISSLIELVGFFSIIPFIALISNIGILDSGIGLEIYQLSGLKSTKEFVIFAGISVLLLFALASIFSVIRLWYTTSFANEVGFKIGDNLYSHYINKNYEFHIMSNSSYLIKQIAVEAIRVKNMTKAVMKINSDMFMVIVIIIAMAIYDAITTLVMVIFIASIYFFLHLKVEGILRSNGEVISSASKDRFKILNNGFGGVSEIIMQGAYCHFTSKMKSTSNRLAHSTSINQIISKIPEKIFQFLIFGVLISIIIYRISTDDQTLSVVVTTLSAYVLAGYKVIPMFQSIFSSIANIKSNMPAIESIYQDIDNTFNGSHSEGRGIDKKISGDVRLENIIYKYADKKNPVIDCLNLVIKKGSKVGIVGSSGSGKTTLIKIISTLLFSKNGVMTVGDVLINEKNAHNWRKMVGLISQDVFLLDGTIVENIAFGCDKDKINFEKVDECIESSNLTEYIGSLSDGVNTQIGERGVQLSGGQRQRIALARALYQNLEFLIMDEATSSLDGATEKEIMGRVIENTKNYTILMIAHRIHTLKKCDVIYIMDKGKIVANGTYEYLNKNNKMFKDMSYSK
jgi:ATP-binding cassette, subfamily B, bacterial PglK